MHIKPNITIIESKYNFESIWTIKKSSSYCEVIQTLKQQNFELAAQQMQKIAVKNLNDAYWLFGKLLVAAMDNNEPNEKRDLFIRELFVSFPKENHARVLKQAFSKLPDQQIDQFLRALEIDPTLATQVPTFDISSAKGDKIDERLQLRFALKNCERTQDEIPFLTSREGMHLA